MQKIRTRDRYMNFIIYVLMGIIVGQTNGTTKEDQQYEKDVTIRFRVLKDIYEPNEPVPLIVVIANHRSEPIYVYGRDPEFLDRRTAWVTDVNGIDMPYDRPPEQTSLPSDHYMEVNGKRVQVAPISRIEPHDVVICWKTDGLERYHGYLPKGDYFLEMKDFPIVHEIDNIIIREDTGNRYWFAPKMTSRTQCFHRIQNKVKIKILKKGKEQQGSEPAQEVVAQSGFVWPTFIGGTILGLILPCAVFLMRKKA